jgi:hypothetical protein
MTELGEMLGKRKYDLKSRWLCFKSAPKHYFNKFCIQSRMPMFTSVTLFKSKPPINIDAGKSLSLIQVTSWAQFVYVKKERMPSNQRNFHDFQDEACGTTATWLMWWKNAIQSKEFPWLSRWSMWHYCNLANVMKECQPIKGISMTFKMKHVALLQPG